MREEERCNFAESILGMLCLLFTLYMLFSALDSILCSTVSEMIILK